MGGVGGIGVNPYMNGMYPYGAGFGQNMLGLNAYAANGLVGMAPYSGFGTGGGMAGVNGIFGYMGQMGTLVQMNNNEIPGERFFI
jgi:hypothetical protein